MDFSNIFSHNLFNSEEEQTYEDLQRKKKIEEQELLLLARRLKALIDSEVWKDLKYFIDILKDQASNEARSLNNPGILYGIDFLDMFERRVIESSTLTHLPSEG